MLDRVLTEGAEARLKAARGFVFDMDGTLVLGDRQGRVLKPLPGAQEMVALLRARGVPFVVFTNGTLATPKEAVGKLRKAGIEIKDKEMMTPSSVAADYFARHRSGRVLVLGCEGVWRPLAEAGIEIVRPAEYRGGADAVLVGWYREFTMRCLEAAFDAVDSGAALFTASHVPFFAAAGGRAIGTSFAIVSMLTALTKKRAKVLGKPSGEAMRAAAKRVGVPAHAIAVVGDDPLTEIKLARTSEALAVGVMSGICDAAGFTSATGDRRADLVFSDIGAVMKAYLGA
jgi:HAD superfamily hydrolase (TIGR01450 family)